MPRPQFRLRSLFILTAIVAVGCLVVTPLVREVQVWLRPKAAFIRPMPKPSLFVEQREQFNGMPGVYIDRRPGRPIGTKDALDRTSPPTE